MSNRYIKTPESISINTIEENSFTLSSSQYMNLIMPNKNFLYVRDFLDRPLKRSDLGIEVGSINYIGKSPFYFVRTKALQSHSFLPDITSETALPIMPKVFHKANLGSPCKSMQVDFYQRVTRIGVTNKNRQVNAA